MIFSNRPRCLLLIGALSPVYQAVLQTLHGIGVDVVFPGDGGTGESWGIDLLHSVDLVVADITGSDPNIMFALGHAYALGRPVLPIVNINQRTVPQALAGYLYLVYDSAQPEQFPHILGHWAKQYIERRRVALSA